MNSVSCVLDESCLAEEEGSGGGRMSFKSKTDGEFKSKNLFAERRRREKLSGRLLALRALVPNITNMNKATIVEDAITYIQELQQKVNLLKDQIFEMEASSEETLEPNTEETHPDAAEEMKKFGIQTEVNVTKIDGNKLWVKAVLEKKRGGFTKLMGAMTAFGFELTDTSITTSSGAMMVSSCVTGFSCETLEVEQTRELMLEIINDM
ncbi:transcription factor DYT1-like [Pyrus communis]|uniref:transcription factor DYT1-like n=1 Tax=Pyrus communis TaxID=23211 RepID=UPI0035C0C26C